MKNNPYTIFEKVWAWQGKGGWHFVTIQKEDAAEIKKDFIWPRKGFGSIPVKSKIGNTEFKTSIFPDKKGTYVLPLKKEIRDKENIKEGDKVKIFLEVIN